MNPEILLKNIRDQAEFALETYKKSLGMEPAQLEKALDRIRGLAEAQLADPEMQIHCGLYLSEGTRQYGYTFEQLQYLVKEWHNPKSVFYQKSWEFPALLKWLYQVSRTSIGDLHGDLFKNVVATYHYPADMTDEEYDALQTKYDTFWEEALKVIEGVDIKRKQRP